MKNLSNILETNATLRPRALATLAGLQCVKPFSNQEAGLGDAWLAANPEVLSDT